MSLILFPVISLNYVNNPYQVAVSKSAAEKYFGTTDVINKELKVLSFDQEMQLIVKAVYEDFPVTSTIKPDFISPLDLAMMQINKFMMSSDNVVRDVSYYKENWELEIFRTYILFDENANPASFAKISDDITALKYRESWRQGILSSAYYGCLFTIRRYIRW